MQLNLRIKIIHKLYSQVISRKIYIVFWHSTYLFSNTLPVSSRSEILLFTCSYVVCGCVYACQCILTDTDMIATVFQTCALRPQEHLHPFWNSVSEMHMLGAANSKSQVCSKRQTNINHFKLLFTIILKTNSYIPSVSNGYITNVTVMLPYVSNSHFSSLFPYVYLQ